MKRRTFFGLFAAATAAPALPPPDVSYPFTPYKLGFVTARPAPTEPTPETFEYMRYRASVQAERRRSAARSK